MEAAIDPVMAFTPADPSVYNVPVTADGDLVGVVSMRELLIAENDEPGAALISADLATGSTTDSLFEVELPDHTRLL